MSTQKQRIEEFIFLSVALVAGFLFGALVGKVLL